jgi:hypothetical protein
MLVSFDFQSKNKKPAIKTRWLAKSPVLDLLAAQG